MSYENPILDIRCPSCGAPQAFDIEKQLYLCQYCGSETGISEALEAKKGFQRLHKKKMSEEAPSFKILRGSCTSCGASLVFPENEALSSCAFCGKSLVRKEYLRTDHFPEILIPFYLTKEEARACLLDWCGKNGSRREARAIRQQIDDLEGFYLPYELVKGPVRCAVTRSGSGKRFQTRSFLDGIFVNTSKQLDNHLLNGIEPFNLTAVKEFDFSFLAGQRVKMTDLDEKTAESRIRDEIAFDYEPLLARSMETQAVRVEPDAKDMVKLAAVLPVYYLRAGETIAAVNGQTGKVAVREAKDRFLLPWWIRPPLATIILTALFFFASLPFSHNAEMSLLISGMLGLVFLIVTFAAYSDYASPRWKLRRRILTSKGGRLVREGGRLTESSEPLTARIERPDFYENIDGKLRKVEIRFSAARRMAGMLLLSILTIFLPFVLAFLFNGLSFKGVAPGGAAVWLCIFVPVVPIWFLKFGRLDIYNKPWVYYRNDNGRKKRYHPGEGQGSLGKTLKSLSAIAGLIIGFSLLLIFNVYLMLNWD